MLLNEGLYTAEEFWELCQLPENADKRWELIEGVIYEMLPTAPRHGYIAMLLGAEIIFYLKTHDIGVLMGTDVGFRLTAKTVYSPDLAYVSNQRDPNAYQLTHYVEYAPDLAVEVVSPGNTGAEITQKVKGYLQHGTALVWVIYPDTQEIHVYRAGQAENEANVTFLGENDTLRGENVLPDFALPLTALFSPRK